ncbi:MAG: folate family ECF transporter S component [Clostridia bacterium]|nr:folate family ECF transporter S component [Clostridia bacterium]
MVKNKKRLFCLVLTSILTAITVVLSRFLSINIWNMSIGFSFVSVMLCGMLLGVFWGGICGGLADLVGALLFPFGPYFPGFTATAFLSGAVFGLIGYFAGKEQKRTTFILLAVSLLVLKETVCSLLLNSLWISLLYGSPFTAVLISRIPLSAITLVLEVALAIVLKEFLIPKVRKEL